MANQQSLENMNRQPTSEAALRLEDDAKQKSTLPCLQLPSLPSWVFDLVDPDRDRVKVNLLSHPSFLAVMKELCRDVEEPTPDSLIGQMAASARCFEPDTYTRSGRSQLATSQGITSGTTFAAELCSLMKRHWSQQPHHSRDIWRRQCFPCFESAQECGTGHDPKTIITLLQQVKTDGDSDFLPQMVIEVSTSVTEAEQRNAERQLRANAIELFHLQTSLSSRPLLGVLLFPTRYVVNAFYSAGENVRSLELAGNECTATGFQRLLNCANVFAAQDNARSEWRHAPTSNVAIEGDRVYKLYDHRKLKTPEELESANHCLPQQLAHLLPEYRIELQAERLTVASYSYIAGEHLPQTIPQMQHLIQAVENLHKLGWVHGDLRYTNVIFRDDDEVFLIDFDFAGPVGTNTYPLVFNTKIADGYRHPDLNTKRGRNRHAQPPAQFEHDYVALAWVLRLTSDKYNIAKAASDLIERGELSAAVTLLSQEFDSCEVFAYPEHSFSDPSSCSS